MSKLETASAQLTTYWLSLADRHSWPNSPKRLNTDAHFLRIVGDHNESLQAIGSNKVQNAIKLMESLYSGCGVVVKDCSDGRNSLILLNGPVFRGIKGPGGMIRTTPDGNGSALSSQALSSEITNTVFRREEPLIIQVAHTSKCSPLDHGCAAEYGDYLAIHDGKVPSRQDLQNFIWQKLDEPRNVVNRYINLQRTNVDQDKLNNCLVTAMRNTDDMSLSFSGGNSRFDIGEYCLANQVNLQQELEFFRNTNPSLNYEGFRELIKDAQGISDVESILAGLCARSFENTGDVFVTRFRAFIEQSSILRNMTTRQKNGLLAYALRNLYLTHLLGYVYDNDQKSKIEGHYPTHPYSEHNEDAFCISREGKHLGAQIPGKQFMLSTPESDQEAIRDILLLTGVIKRHSSKDSHPLIVSDSDQSVLRRYMLCILQNPDILSIFEKGFLYPYPVLLKPGDSRKIQMSGIVM